MTDMLLKYLQCVHIFLNTLAFLEKSLFIVCSRIGRVVCYGKEKKLNLCMKGIKLDSAKEES